MGKRKSLTEEDRTIAYNVFKYIENLSNGVIKVPESNSSNLELMNATASATGLSLSSVKRVLKLAKEAETDKENEIEQPAKKIIVLSNEIIKQASIPDSVENPADDFQKAFAKFVQPSVRKPDVVPESVASTSLTEVFKSKPRSSTNPKHLTLIFIWTFTLNVNKFHR